MTYEEKDILSVVGILYKKYNKINFKYPGIRWAREVDIVQQSPVCCIVM